MRRFLVACLSLSVALCTVPGVARAEEPDAAAQDEAKRLYDQGRTAYRLGKFKDAVDAWEKSFELSKGNPLLLYNISLAYRGLYGITGELKDLRQSKAVLDNFIKVAQADAALEGEIADAQTRLDELAVEIAEAERRAAAAEPPPGDARDAGAPSAAELARAKKLRLAGAITMGVGGAVFLTGASLGTFYVVKSNEFTNQVSRDRTAASNALEDAGVAAGDARDCVEDNSVADAALDYAHGDAGIEAVPVTCRGAVQELADLAQTRINGKKANTLSIVGFAVVGGIGLAALIAGAVVFAQGNRAARGGRTARVQLTPSFGRTGTGFVLSGRF